MRPSRSAGAIVALSALAVAACRREARDYRELPARTDTPPVPQVGELRPGGAPAPAPTRARAEFSAYDVSEGKRLYAWFNCVGCHAHGGGGMGPPLMDRKWIYGSAPENIYATIVEGRPNGMPSFRGKIPDQQVWQIVAYVRSLSGLVPHDVPAARADHMAAKPPESLMTPEPPRPPERPVREGAPH